MVVELITKEDLKAFRTELLEDLKPFLAPAESSQKKWLKGVEVRKLLKISSGSLQNLRISGQLKPAKVGGSFYYRYSDIEALLNAGK